MKQIGILGGGQLARMMALAGEPLGFEFIFIDPASDACAQSLGTHQAIPWDDPRVPKLLEHADCVTFDFENVPSKTLDDLIEHCRVRPAPNALRVSQDRALEKALFESIQASVAPYVVVDDRPGLLSALEVVGYPAILKTRRLGYDGKGQYRIQNREDLEPAWQALGDHPLIIEGWVAFESECALTATRASDGQVAFYPLTETRHHEGILEFALSPSPVTMQRQAEAERVMRQLLLHLDYVGSLTVEFFVTEQGLVVNEFAPRVHNSAHWTIEGTPCSQFENHIRAIMDLPLGSSENQGVALMMNFIGQLPEPALLNVRNLHWHDYHKQERAGRKVGHATWLADDLDALRAQQTELQAFLSVASYDRLTRWLKSIGS